MKLMSYADALKAGKEKVNEMLIPTRVRRARKQGELEMCKLEEEIAIKETKLQEIASDEDVNFSRIIDVQDELALLNRKREQYQALLDELFPMEKAAPAD